jgi:hypothetical protein
MEVIERARRYLAKMDGSVSGAGGHNACFAAAVAMVKGFDLPEGVALELLRADFNPRCAPAWSERELMHKVRQAGRANSASGYLLGNDTRRATAEDWKKHERQDRAVVAEKVKKDQAIDENALRRMVVREVIDERFFLERSPVDVGALSGPEEFLGTLYQEGEKVLVFTSERSQGDFGFEVNKGEGFPGRSFRLGSRPGVKPEAAPLPRSARMGAWLLANPVSGKWAQNGGLDRDKRPMLSRRSAPNVTSWRFLLLESDEVAPEVWMNVIAQLPLPIAALYTSGGRSVHALVQLDAKTQDELRQATEWLGPVLAKLGGDWKALSSVRLTRLPMVFREGRMVEDGQGGKKYERYAEPRLQRLLWLDPEPEARAILTRPKIRDVDERTV